MSVGLSNRNYFTALTPKCEEVVVVKLSNITDNGIYGTCITYPDYEVFLMLTEITKKKYKVNVVKMFSPDKKYAVVVINVNDDKKIIDVSYSKVHETDQKGVLERQSFYEKIYNLGIDVVKTYKKMTTDGTYKFNQEEMDMIFKYVVQIPLNNLENDPDKTSIEKVKDKFLTYLEEPNSLFEILNIEYVSKLEQNSQSFFEILQKNFIENLNKRVKISDVVISCDFTLCVIESGAVDVIKQILNIDIQDFKKIKIEHISSPKYRITVTEKRLNEARATLDKTCSIIKDNANKFGKINITITLDIPEKYTVMKDKEWTISNYNFSDH